jgi:hypothetical protein
MRAILIDPRALSKCLFEPFFQGRILKGQKTVARWLSPICTELVDNCFGHSSGKKRRIFFTYRSAILSFANSDLGRVLLRLSAQANIERAKEGTRRLKWSVGFLTGAPHLQWSKIYKATSGWVLRSWRMAVVQADAFSASYGGAGCSLRKSPPNVRCQIQAIMAWNIKALPCLNWRSSLLSDRFWLRVLVLLCKYGCDQVISDCNFTNSAKFLSYFEVVSCNLLIRFVLFVCFVSYFS